MMFSVLVPVYNVEKYISQCIESIIRQTEYDYELILVDDGSKDSSGMICDEYQSRFPDKIKVIHQENKGLLLTRRVSITEAKGDYCIFVDSDDYIREDTLEVIKRTIIENSADLVIYNYMLVTDEGRQLAQAPVFPNGKTFTDENKVEIYQKLLKDNSLNNLVLKAVKKKLIDKNFDYYAARHVSNAEDLLQTLLIVTNARKIVYINEGLYYYRQNISSMTKVFNSNWYDSVTYVYKQLMNYMKIWKLDNEYGMGLFRQRYIQLIIDAIRQITFPSCTWNLVKRREYLEKLANDEYFINAYDNANYKFKNISWYITLAFLRKKKILLVLYITNIRRLIAIITMKNRKIFCNLSQLINRNKL